jgi:hypothetical protein
MRAIRISLGRRGEARKFAYKHMFKPFKNISMDHPRIVDVYIAIHIVPQLQIILVLRINIWYVPFGARVAQSI